MKILQSNPPIKNNKIVSLTEIYSLLFPDFSGLQVGCTRV